MAAGLSHPNIAVVHDIGQTGDVPYLVMELVAGRTMAEVAGGEATDPALAAVCRLDDEPHAADPAAAASARPGDGRRPPCRGRWALLLGWS